MLKPCSAASVASARCTEGGMRTTNPAELLLCQCFRYGLARSLHICDRIGNYAADTRQRFFRGGGKPRQRRKLRAQSNVLIVLSGPSDPVGVVIDHFEYSLVDDLATASCRWHGCFRFDVVFQNKPRKLSLGQQSEHWWAHCAFVR